MILSPHEAAPKIEAIAGLIETLDSEIDALLPNASPAIANRLLSIRALDHINPSTARRLRDLAATVEEEAEAADAVLEIEAAEAEFEAEIAS